MPSLLVRGPAAGGLDVVALMLALRSLQQAACCAPPLSAQPPVGRRARRLPLLLCALALPAPVPTGWRPTATRAGRCWRPAAARAARATCTSAAWRPGWRQWRTAKACTRRGTATCAGRGTAGGPRESCGAVCSEVQLSGARCCCSAAAPLCCSAAAACGCLAPTACRTRSHTRRPARLETPRRLPRALQLRESPSAWAERHVRAVLASPAGAVLQYYTAGGLLFSSAWALRGAWLRLAGAGGLQAWPGLA